MPLFGHTGDVADHEAVASSTSPSAWRNKPFLHVHHSLDQQGPSHPSLSYSSAGVASSPAKQDGDSTSLATRASVGSTQSSIVRAAPGDTEVLDVGNNSIAALVGSFFGRIHPSIPLFNEASFRHAVSNAHVDLGVYDLLLAITLRVLHSAPSATGGHNAEAYLDSQLAVLDGTPAGALNPVSSLQDVQKACLLAHYGFHHKPGLKSWTRIGQLTRKAYALGLSQLDATHTDERPVPFTGVDSIDEWRRAWWVIYCLDSYSSVTAGTPFVVEHASIATALKYVQPQTQNNHIRVYSVFLPPDLEDLWETAGELASEAEPDHFSIHIVSTVLLKEAATLYRLEKQRPSKGSRSRMLSLEDHIAAVRLALPPGYLGTTRSILSNESVLSFHSRMINTALMAKASILLSLASLMNQREQATLASGWQKIVQRCEEVVAVVRQWDTQMLTIADPAICFIISVVLALLHLYSKCEPALSEESRSTLARHENILKLFLQQFAVHWYLSRFALGSYEKLRNQISNTITYAEALQAMKISHGLLFQKEPIHTSNTVSQPRHSVTSDATVLGDMTWLDSLDMGEWNLFDGFFGIDGLQLPQ